MLEKLNVEGEKLGVWRELMGGVGEWDGKRKKNVIFGNVWELEQLSSWELKELYQVALSVNQ